MALIKQSRPESGLGLSHFAGKKSSKPFRLFAPHLHSLAFLILLVLEWHQVFFPFFITLQPRVE